MTTAAVPSTDPVDFLLNVETLDEAINSSGPNLIDRLGNNRSTLNGAIDSLKAFNVRGAWVTATAYVIKDVYTSAGIAYVTVVAHISTSIAADLAAGYVTVHQGMTREDLAAPSGASLLGWIQAGLGAVLRLVQDKLRENVSVLDFGAVGDGVADDTVAIQKAIDSISVFPLTSGELIFPNKGAFYRITDTLHCGRFSISANNNVNGFSAGCFDLTLTLRQPIKWDGADQPGSTKVTKTDTVGTYPLITDDNPMISVVACRGLKITGRLDAESVDGTRHAFSGIWFQGNHNVHCLEKLSVVGSPRIGVRNGCAWDLVGGVAYWGYADSPYYKANVYNAPAVGGWQGDTQGFTACALSGTLAHYSTESGQNLSVTFNSTSMGEGATTATYGIVMVGGRITANGLNINKASTYDVWMITGSNSFTGTDIHSESAATVKMRTSTAAVSPNITLTNHDACAITLAGGGANLTITDSVGVNVIRNDIGAQANITIENSEVVNLAVANTGAKSSVNIKLQNCALGAPLLTGVSAYNCYFAAENCSNPTYLPAQSGSFYSVKESFNGQTHTVKNKIAIPHNVATLVGTISTAGAGNASTGTCLLRMNFSTQSSTSMASVFGLYSFAWTRDNGAVITLSAVSVINEAKALDNFTAFAPVVTVSASGANVLITTNHTNNFSLDSVCELQGEVYVGGNYSTVLDSVWTAA